MTTASVPASVSGWRSATSGLSYASGVRATLLPSVTLAKTPLQHDAGGFPVRCALMPPFLIELPADEPERARRFWQELLQTTLESRRPEEGRGWHAEHDGIVLGLHERGPGPGD